MYCSLCGDGGEMFLCDSCEKAMCMVSVCSISLSHWCVCLITCTCTLLYKSHDWCLFNLFITKYWCVCYMTSICSNFNGHTIKCVFNYLISVLVT